MGRALALLCERLALLQNGTTATFTTAIPFSEPTDLLGHIPMHDTITEDIKTFVVSNFLYGQDGQNLTVDQSFLESGIIDSTGVLELVAFLEQQFGIAVADRELLPENLDSVQNAAAFVTRKLAAQGAQVAG